MAALARIAADCDSPFQLVWRLALELRLSPEDLRVISGHAEIRAALLEHQDRWAA